MTFDFLDKKERDYSMASLMQAYRLGLIENPRLAAVEQRRQVENRRRRETLEKGETVYGPEQYSPIAYLYHELTELSWLMLQKAQPLTTEKFSVRSAGRKQDAFMKYTKICLPDIREMYFHMKMWN